MRRIHLLLVSVVLLTSCTTHFSTAATPALQSWLPLLGSSAFGSLSGRQSAGLHSRGRPGVPNGSLTLHRIFCWAMRGGRCHMLR